MILRWWALLVAVSELALACGFFYYTIAIAQAVNRKRRADEHISYFNALLRNVPLLQEYERLYPDGTLARKDRAIISLLLAVVLLSLLVRIFIHI